MKYLYVAILFFLLGCLMTWQGCKNKTCPELKPQTITTIIRDTVIKTVKGKDITHTNTIIKNHTDSFYKSVDTSAILHDYFAVNTFATTIADSNIQATQFDTVTNNSLIGTGLKYVLKKPTQVITNTTVIKAETWHLNIGLASSFAKKEVFCIAPILGYESKKGISVSGGYDFINSTAIGSVQVRIK